MGAHFPTGYSKAIKGNCKATTATKAITATEDTKCRHEFPPKYCYLDNYSEAKRNAEARRSRAERA